jgi:hypothetical protein
MGVPARLFFTVSHLRSPESLLFIVCEVGGAEASRFLVRAQQDGDFQLESAGGGPPPQTPSLLVQQQQWEDCCPNCTLDSIGWPQVEPLEPGNCAVSGKWRTVVTHSPVRRNIGHDRAAPKASFLHAP